MMVDLAASVDQNQFAVETHEVVCLCLVRTVTPFLMKALFDVYQRPLRYPLGGMILALSHLMVLNMIARQMVK